MVYVNIYKDIFMFEATMASEAWKNVFRFGIRESIDIMYFYFQYILTDLNILNGTIYTDPFYYPTVL